jgi:hypothetical protein
MRFIAFVPWITVTVTLHFIRKSSEDRVILRLFSARYEHKMLKEAISKNALQSRAVAVKYEIAPPTSPCARECDARQLRCGISLNDLLDDSEEFSRHFKIPISTSYQPLESPVTRQRISRLFAC